MNYNKNNNYYRKPYYNYTSEAYDYDLYTDRVPTVKKRVLKKKKIKYIKSETNINWLSSKFIFAIFIVFTFSTCLLSFQGKITKTQMDIVSLNSQLKSIYQDNEYLSIELSKSIDLNEVEQLAITKIGMQYPTSTQVVYINVPKESYTVKNETDNDKQNGFLFKLLASLNF